MRTPDLMELRMVARFKVNDVVWIRSSGPWTVVARFWVKSKGHIAYDLQYSNGVVLPRVADDEVFETRKHM